MITSSVPPVTRLRAARGASGTRSHRRLGAGGVFGLKPGPAPDRRPLIDVEPADVAGDRGDDLHGAGPSADDRDALAAEVVVVVPLGGVDDLALEVVEARDLGRLR